MHGRNKKEAYAAEQIQQMEAYCETIAGAVKEEAANKEEESVLCKKNKKKTEMVLCSRR